MHSFFFSSLPPPSSLLPPSPPPSSSPLLSSFGTEDGTQSFALSMPLLYLLSSTPVPRTQGIPKLPPPASYQQSSCLSLMSRRYYRTCITVPGPFQFGFLLSLCPPPSLWPRLTLIVFLGRLASEFLQGRLESEAERQTEEEVVRFG